MQAANILHASGESAVPTPESGTVAVALHAKDENHLRSVAARLTNAGIEHHCVTECDDDEDYPGQLMAIGVNPREGKVACLSDLPLVK